MLSDELMAAAKFDENDLIVNRQGHLSEKQKAKLQRDQLKFMLFAGILIGVSLSSFLALGLDVIRNQQQGEKIAGVFILTVVALALIALSIEKWRQLSADLSKDAVASVNGKASLRLIPRGRNLTYRLRVNDVKFDTPWKIYRCIERGKLYRIYYAPRSKRILCIERLH
jgi:hypothetical protein